MREAFPWLENDDTTQEALLRERELTPAPADAKLRVSTQLASMIADFGPLELPTQAQERPADPTATGGGALASSAASGTSAGVATLLAKPVVMGLAGLVLGTGLGAGVTTSIMKAPDGSSSTQLPNVPNLVIQSSEVREAVDAHVAMEASIDDDRPSVIQSSRSIVPPTVSGVVSAEPSASAPVVMTKDEQLAADRALVDRARTALLRGDGQQALTSLLEHQRTFPSSRFGVEREALMIQALVAAGRKSDARLRAAEFRIRHPNSPLLPAVESSVR